MAADQDDPPGAPGQPVAAFKAQEYRLAYANVFRTRIGPMDTTINFGVQTDHPLDGNQAAIREEFGVVLAPPVLKALAESLTYIVQALEAHGGQIKVPLQLVPNEENLKSMTATVMRASLPG